mmetsp:Transcript_18895/g.41147  ORF Transcript_18895/g.41147 Transcript_18895/m.41147 type:complete len:707 (+) Transcript_18895:298-2418(+)
MSKCGEDETFSRTPRSRRKQIQNNGDAAKKHSQTNDNGFNNSTNENGDNAADDDDDCSFSPYKATTSSNGRVARFRRRKNRSNGARRKSSRILGTCGASCLFVGFIIAVSMWGNPSDLPTLPLSEPSSDPAGNEIDKEKENKERILNKILHDNDNSPLTEKQEQEMLQISHDELNEFPISIGTDNTSHNWETIQHPGTEALQYHSKGNFHPLKRKRATASELVGVLSGKKMNALRGGHDTTNANGTGNNNNSGSDNIEEGYMRVPKFWDPLPYRIIADEREQRSGKNEGSDGGSDPPPPTDLPRDGVRRYLGNFGSRLMTPAEAKSIGSRIPSSQNDGALLETIFVAVASYRDWQCPQTVESAFSRASHPERIRVAVVDQIRFGRDTPCSIPPGGPCEENPNQATCKHLSQIDYFTVDADLSVGPVFARHLGHRLYRGEYFAMQSDAHVEFVQRWDDEIIEQWHTARNEMAILSTYLSGVEKHIDLETGERTSKSRPIMCASDFEGYGDMKHLRHGQQPEGVTYIHDMPTLNPFWAAGFSFGRGHFVVNVPYDQHLPWIFQGEEISIGLRGFSYGYDYYSPEKAACYHYYGRDNVPMFWENSSIYRGSGDYGMNRLNAIIRMATPSRNGKSKEWIRTDELKYGIGRVRDLQLFFDIFGIHVKEQTVEKHLCRFVGRPMQKEFIPFLRTNEMGLDYDRITYRYVDKE